MARVLGITGGIGSGKSYVSRFFESLGCPRYDSDSRTKMLYQQDKGLLSALADLLGPGILGPEGLNRKDMASIIFSDKELLEKVKQLVYPYVMGDFKKWKRWKRGVVLFESAVILENDYVRSFMDRTLVVTAPLEVRIGRVMERDGCTREEVEQRLRNQCDDSERIRKADFVIENVEGTDLKAEAEEIISFMKAVKR